LVFDPRNIGISDPKSYIGSGQRLLFRIGNSRSQDERANEQDHASHVQFLLAGLMLFFHYHRQGWELLGGLAPLRLIPILGLSTRRAIQILRQMSGKPVVTFAIEMAILRANGRV